MHLSGIVVDRATEHTEESTSVSCARCFSEARAHRVPPLCINMQKSIIYVATVPGKGIGTQCKSRERDRPSHGRIHVRSTEHASVDQVSAVRPYQELKAFLAVKPCHSCLGRAPVMVRAKLGTLQGSSPEQLKLPKRSSIVDPEHGEA